MKELQNILAAFEQSQKKGELTALATVVKTSGSVYRRPGARMLLTEEGQMIGCVSGGCLESDVFEKAQALMFADGIPVVVNYDTTVGDDIVWGFGLGCNGVQDLRNCHKQWRGVAAPCAKQLGNKHGNIRTF
ncbi:XdhC family protein [Nostoc sp. FACHB-888]|uniref:XdhC family protein n=1 Tax=Nostoc sp. FACHB-888 TaxID=2692842 RepID=UPI00168A3BBC|nr:XdhC family protein [Nostoc sp. FACHB-888]MBD2247318.1 XdhC family protein [Nostoc sp. FACHB-888]